MFHTKTTSIYFTDQKTGRNHLPAERDSRIARCALLRADRSDAKVGERKSEDSVWILQQKRMRSGQWRGVSQSSAFLCGRSAGDRHSSLGFDAARPRFYSRDQNNSRAATSGVRQAAAPENDRRAQGTFDSPIQILSFLLIFVYRILMSIKNFMFLYYSKTIFICWIDSAF